MGVIIHTYGFVDEPDQEPSTSKGVKRPRGEDRDAEKIPCKSETVKEIYGTRDVLKAQEIMTEMARMRIYRGIDQKISKRKGNDLSKLGKRNWVVRDPDLRDEIEKTIHEVMGEEVESITS